MKENKEVIVAFRLSKEEKKALKAYLKKTKQNASDLFRDLLKQLNLVNHGKN